MTVCPVLPPLLLSNGKRHLDVPTMSTDLEQAWQGSSARSQLPSSGPRGSFQGQLQQASIFPSSSKVGCMCLRGHLRQSVGAQKETAN